MNDISVGFYIAIAAVLIIISCTVYLCLLFRYCKDEYYRRVRFECIRNRINRYIAEHGSLEDINSQFYGGCIDYNASPEYVREKQKEIFRKYKSVWMCINIIVVSYVVVIFCIILLFIRG